jgi:hypothetical protein
MKWIDQWFYRKHQWAAELAANKAAESDHDSFNESYVSMSTESKIQSQGFRLEVYRAVGGLVVESTMYNTSLDDDRHALYVVNDDADLGQELAKIITAEQLKL